MNWPGWEVKKPEGTPEAKLYLCCHTWHLQALGLVLLGSGTDQSPTPQAFVLVVTGSVWLSQVRSLCVPRGLDCHLVAGAGIYPKLAVLSIFLLPC